MVFADVCGDFVGLVMPDGAYLGVDGIDPGQLFDPVPAKLGFSGQFPLGFGESIPEPVKGAR